MGNRPTSIDNSTGQTGPPRVSARRQPRISAPPRATKRFLTTDDQCYDFDPSVHPAAFRSYKKATGEWGRILRFLLEYYGRNRNNPHTVVLSRQMVEIAYRSFDGRLEANGQGWSREFVQFVFTFSVDEMEKNQTFWDTLPGTEKHRAGFHTSHSDITFSAQIAGDYHFKRHLRPAFRKYVYDNVNSVLRSVPENRRLTKLSKFLRELTAEHESFIDKAVIPGLNAVDELLSLIQLVGQRVVEGRARALRKQVIFNTLVRFHKHNMISEKDVRYLLPKVDIHTGGSLTEY